jgi:hypothetical protein
MRRCPEWRRRPPTRPRQRHCRTGSAQEIGLLLRGLAAYHHGLRFRLAAIESARSLQAKLCRIGWTLDDKSASLLEFAGHPLELQPGNFLQWIVESIAQLLGLRVLHCEITISDVLDILIVFAGTNGMLNGN